MIIKGKQIDPASLLQSGIVTATQQRFSGRKEIEEVVTLIPYYPAEDVTQGDTLFIQEVLGSYVSNKSISNLRQVHGLAYETVTAGTLSYMVISGPCPHPLAVPASYSCYLGDTLGSISDNPPTASGLISQRIGRCIRTGVIYVELDEPYLIE